MFAWFASEKEKDTQDVILFNTWINRVCIYDLQIKCVY